MGASPSSRPNPAYFRHPDRQRGASAATALQHRLRLHQRSRSIIAPLTNCPAIPLRFLHSLGQFRTKDGRVLRAARLAGGRKQDALTRALRDDPHLGPFLSIPSKDNGFDIEGLAAAPNGRLFLGLRGPVLDGWACILEIHVAARLDRNHDLTLQKITTSSAAPARALYRKHFLNLGGSGVRDLCCAGRDLLILTGPPMRGKGASQVRRWKDALARNGESILSAKQLPTLLELPYRSKKDHAEGITPLARRSGRIWLLVIYDSVGKERRVPPAGMRATLHELSLPP